MAPFTYQWLFDGTAMAGATNSAFSVANAQPAQSGYYSVIVSNASGSVTSQVAELKVFVAAPHGFSGIQAESDGSVSLSFKGETTALFAPYYDLYPLETSSNLVDWAPLVNVATHEYGAGHAAIPGCRRATVQPALLSHADECIAHTYPSADRPLLCWDFLDAANRPVPH